MDSDLELPSTLTLRRVLFGLERGTLHFSKSMANARPWRPHRLSKRCAFEVTNRLLHNFLPVPRWKHLPEGFLASLKESHLLEDESRLVALSFSYRRARVRLVILSETFGACFVKFTPSGESKNAERLPSLANAERLLRGEHDPVSVSIFQQFQSGSFDVEVLEFVPKRLPLFFVTRKQLRELYVRMLAEKVTHDDLMPWNVGVRACGELVLLDRESVSHVPESAALEQLLDRRFEALVARLPWVTRVRLGRPTRWSTRPQTLRDS